MATSASIHPSAHGVDDLGDPSLYWKNAYIQSLFCSTAFTAASAVFNGPVRQEVDSPAHYIIDQTNTGVSQLYLGDAASNTVGGLQYNHSTDVLGLRAGNANRLSIDGTNGNVAIGTATSGSWRLDTVGAGTDGVANFLHSETTKRALRTRATSTSYAGVLADAVCARTASSAFTFWAAYSGNFADTEFSFRGDGYGYGTAFVGTGADYAEYFEWLDDNPNNEDRRGWSVVLVGNKIRRALPGETPIGVISGNPSVVGDAAWNKWSEKYLKDDFNSYVMEDYEVVEWVEVKVTPSVTGEVTEHVDHSYAADAIPDSVTVPSDAVRTTQQRRTLNLSYDPTKEYTARADRQEWDCVGLMGKLRMIKGEQVDPRWIKMRDISDTVEEWLVR